MLLDVEQGNEPIVGMMCRMAAQGSAADSSTRTETDTMGSVEVPTESAWGASTQRAVNNFDFGGGPLPPALVHALGAVKAAAARANVDVGAVDQAVGEAIAFASDEVASGLHDQQFPVDRFQTGSGTSSNTNANEVIARLASLRRGDQVHPNDQVNASQSSNDVFPTAIHVAVALSLTHDLKPALTELAETLDSKAREFSDVVKSGRTHLMDAAPLTLGLEFSGYHGQVTLAVERIDAVLPRVLELALGGTAVGTGLNAPQHFADRAIDHLSTTFGLAFRRARFPQEAQSARDALVEVSGQLRVIALSLYKIANDVRWMGSGPNAGLAEISLPALQPGSSIMPGKVNPVIPEAVMQVCAQVVGNDAAVSIGATTSAFELNTAMPLMGCNVLDSIRWLSGAVRGLTSRTISGITADTVRLRQQAESSPAIATALNTLVGYEAATAVVKKSLREGISIASAAQSLVDDGTVTSEQLADALDVDNLASGESVD